VNLTGLTLQGLISKAYGVNEYQVKGPDSVLRERYTILATTPPDTADATVWVMLRKLLDDRLELKLRRGPEEISVYALTRAKELKLKSAAGGPMSIRYAGGAFVGKNATTTGLANFLSGFLDRPVVDLSGAEGVYDFTLAFTPDPSLGIGMSKLAKEMEYAGTELHGGSIFTAVQEQLGLKLPPRKHPLEVLTIESVRRFPVEN
jgi:uncharacterized protein (TIGR03435 family)